MQKITPFLWFNDQAEEAVNYYLTIFDNSKIKHTARYDRAGAEVSGKEEGSVMTVAFELDGQDFVAINGGLLFKFTEAISFVVNCDLQEEVDWYWEKLSAGGEEGQCGWLKDKFGVSWQIVPTMLSVLLSDPDRDKSQRVMKAMLGMKKIDIVELNRVHDSPG